MAPLAHLFDETERTRYRRVHEYSKGAFFPDKMRPAAS